MRWIRIPLGRRDDGFRNVLIVFFSDLLFRFQLFLFLRIVAMFASAFFLIQKSLNEIAKFIGKFKER